MEFIADRIDLANHREGTQKPRSQLETWDLYLEESQTLFPDSVTLIRLKRGLQQELTGILPDAKEFTDFTDH